MLKGAYLVQLYPEGTRTSNDLDILVSRDSVTELSALLKKHGFIQGFIRNDRIAAADRSEVINAMLHRGETIPFVKEVNLPCMKFMEVDVNTLTNKNPDQTQNIIKIMHAVSDRLQYSNCFIEPLLRQGKNVISDRYFYSCLANLRARGFDNDRWIYEIAENIIEPDIFFIDVPVDIAVKRVRERPHERDRYIDIELQYKLRQNYINNAQDVGGIVISGIDSLEKCQETVRKKVFERGICLKLLISITQLDL